MSVFRRHGPVALKTGPAVWLAEQLKLVDLKPVRRVTFKFDPFHPNTREFRKLMFCLSSPRIRDTNFDCVYKTEVLSDFSEPLMLCKLENGQQIKFEAANLNVLEILQSLNRIVLPLIPPQEELSPADIPKTKSQRRR